MENSNVVAGVTLAPPVVGRITMGHVAVRGDKAIPQKDDFFRITSLVQNKDRSWEAHPIEATVRRACGAQAKLAAIPVRIAYDAPSLTLINRYTAFDGKSGRVLCAGNGARARRATEDAVRDIGCPRPEACEYGVRMRCKSYTRVHLRIEGQTDEFGVFVLRTTGHNTLRYLSARLNALHGLTHGKLAGLPMLLVLRAKSTTASFREPVYFADLTTRPEQTLLAAIEAMRAYQREFEAAGLSLPALEAQLLAGLANGDFSDEIEDVDEWVGDETLLTQATGNLARQGLRGLDAAVAAAAPNAVAAALKRCDDATARAESPEPGDTSTTVATGTLPSTEVAPATARANADATQMASPPPSPAGTRPLLPRNDGRPPLPPALKQQTPRVRAPA
jgi:hypothetical protein